MYFYFPEIEIRHIFLTIQGDLDIDDILSIVILITMSGLRFSEYIEVLKKSIFNFSIVSVLVSFNFIMYFRHIFENQ